MAYRMQPALLTAFLGIIAGGSVAAQQPSAKKYEPTPEQRIAANRKLQYEIMLETKLFQEEMPMKRFLETVEKNLPKEHKLARKTTGTHLDFSVGTPRLPRLESVSPPHANIA